MRLKTHYRAYIDWEQLLLAPHLGYTVVTMNPRLKFAAAWVAGLVVAASQTLAADFFIHDGDRVVFLGDSITEQRLYTTYIEAYALTRHPEWKLSFRNVGWGGDTAWLRQRSHPPEDKLFAAKDDAQQQMVEDSVGRGLARDVLPLKPTVVTVKFGMNDHAYQTFRPDIFAAYTRSQTEIAKVLSKNGARVAFLTPQPIEDKRPDPDKDNRNQSLRKFSDGLKEVAEAQHSQFADQFDPYMGVMLSARTTNAMALIGGGDAVHPGPAGHTIMAWAVMKALGATALVSRAEIDVAAQKVSAAEACKVTNLKVDGTTISFDRLDDALPMPIDPKAESALKLAPILSDLDRYELQITGLTAGTYQVSIDDESAGELSSSDLTVGWNLANAPGPITKQAREVLRLVFEKNNIYFGRWRNVQLFTLPGWAQGPEAEKGRAAELAKLDQEVSDKEAKIEVARKPKTHHFVIKAVTK
ncbi:MAG TPA: SGNH/GDSL hydrolase family protein [Candidatus Limnocylindria bacterium]|nr:SGNH/GDSL hydrolase family protein [Candidatus Limnocylindria bacterium]